MAKSGWEELRTAAREFHERVFADLLERYPGLVDNPGARKFFEPPVATAG